MTEFKKKPPLKPKKCSHCKKRFQPWNSLEVACSVKCALGVTRSAKEKAERQRLKRDRERVKTRSQWMKEAQQAFNAFVRERDKGKPCISCGSTPDDSGLITGSKMDAGHYRSTGACPELRFEELNCHAQCVKCNQHLSGNTVEYRIRLRMRIGDQRVEWLEGKHESQKYTIDDLREIKRHYQKKKRELSNAPSQAKSR